MARGTIAKEKVVKTLESAFGQNWIGEYDKKYFVWSEENGEKIQIAISLTCPKNPVGDIANMDFGNNEMNFETMGTVQEEQVEITADEQDNLKKLMERLGL